MSTGPLIMKPSSISVSTGTGTISSNGGVQVTGVDVVNLNGVFTSAFTNYTIMWDCRQSGIIPISYRLRASGSDNTSAAYTRQYMQGNGATAAGARTTGNTAGTIGYHAAGGLIVINIYAPALTDYTILRTIGGIGISAGDIQIYEIVDGHSVSASYDGISFYVGTGTFSGTITVYGYPE